MHACMHVLHMRTHARRDDRHAGLHARSSAGTQALRCVHTYARTHAEVHSYLTEVTAHYKSLEAEEDKELLVTNVLEQLAGKEASIAADPTCSRQIEALLASAQPAQLTAFLGACMDTGIFLMASRCGRGPVCTVSSSVPRRPAPLLHHCQTNPQNPLHTQPLWLARGGEDPAAPGDPAGGHGGG